MKLLGPHTPLVFADGTATYDMLAKTYRLHKKGFFIMAPSGAGKTHFVRQQKQPDWLDGDDLWMAAKAHPSGAWWDESIERITEIDSRCWISVRSRRSGTSECILKLGSPGSFVSILIRISQTVHAYVYLFYLAQLVGLEP